MRYWNRRNELMLGYTTGVSSVCDIVNTYIREPELLNYPICTLCNRQVARFIKEELFDVEGWKFMAMCHGRTEERIVTRGGLLADTTVMMRGWFQDDYEKLNAGLQREIRSGSIEKPTRRIDIDR